MSGNDELRQAIGRLRMHAEASWSPTMRSDVDLLAAALEAAQAERDELRAALDELTPRRVASPYQQGDEPLRPDGTCVNCGQVGKHDPFCWWWQRYGIQAERDRLLASPPSREGDKT